MSNNSTSCFQLSGDEASQQNDQPSYQLQQYLDAKPTVTERITQSLDMSKTQKTRGKKHQDKLKEQMDSVDKIMGGQVGK